MKAPLDFVCIGPQRTATSWLHFVLQQHPDAIFPFGVKETMFFDQRYDKGLSWYDWHFADGEGFLRGEIAPTYFDSVQACQRLAKHCPRLRIIVLVRNPVERTHSLYRHNVSKGRVRGDFSEALIMDPLLVSSGRYAVHCQRWEAAFSPDQVLYVLQEEISIIPQAVLDRICKHIGLGSFQFSGDIKEVVNSATAPRNATLALIFSRAATLLFSMRLYRFVHWAKKGGLKNIYRGGRAIPPMNSDCYQSLLGEFASDIEWLERKTGWDLSAWRKIPK